jgi:hypothetical protein
MHNHIKIITSFGYRIVFLMDPVSLLREQKFNGISEEYH